MFGQSAAVPTVFAAHVCGVTKLAMPINQNVVIADMRFDMSNTPNLYMQSGIRGGHDYASRSELLDETTRKRDARVTTPVARSSSRPPIDYLGGTDGLQIDSVRSPRGPEKVIGTSVLLRRQVGELAENREDARSKSPAILVSVAILIFADELFATGPYQRGHDAGAGGLMAAHLNEQIVYQWANARFRRAGARHIVSDRIAAGELGARAAGVGTADERFSDFEHGVCRKQMGALGAISPTNVECIGVDEIGNLGASG